MIVTDASIWVSAMRYDDINNQATNRWLTPYVAGGGTIRAPELLLVEVSGALARRTNSSRLGRAALETLKGYDYLHLYAVDHVLACLAAELAADCQLRGADAVYVALAYTRNVPLVTWDQEQIMRVQAVITAGTPLTLFNNGTSPEQDAP